MDNQNPQQNQQQPLPPVNPAPPLPPQSPQSQPIPPQQPLPAGQPDQPTQQPQYPYPQQQPPQQPVQQQPTPPNPQQEYNQTLDKINAEWDYYERTYKDKLDRNTPTANEIAAEFANDEDGAKRKTNELVAENKRTLERIKSNFKFRRENEARIKRDFPILNNTTSEYVPELHAITLELNQAYENPLYDTTGGGGIISSNDMYIMNQKINDVYQIGLKKGYQQGVNSGQQQVSNTLSQMNTQLPYNPNYQGATNQPLVNVDSKITSENLEQVPGILFGELARQNQPQQPPPPRAQQF